MTRPLNKTQAFLLTLFTGQLLMDGEEFRSIINKKLDREVNPIEFSNDEFIREVQALYVEDWAQLTNVVEDSGLILFK